MRFSTMIGRAVSTLPWWALLPFTPGCSQPGLVMVLDHLPIPQHPFLAPNGRNNMHNDSFMTDSYEIGGPLGQNSKVELKSYATGINTCVTMVFDQKNRILTTSAALIDFKLLMLDPDTLEALASYSLPSRDLFDPLFPYQDTSGAAYFVLDNQDRVLLTDAENAIQIIKFEEDRGELSRVRRFDLSQFVVAKTPPARDHVQMTIPDWQGKRLWFTTRYGKVGTVGWEGDEARTTELQGEEIQNSFAVGEDGVYIISDHAMYRFSSDATGLPVVDWRTEYDRGNRVKPSNFNQGSGTTPHLFTELVAIGDNAEPRMNILFLRRKDGTEAGRIPVFAEGLSTTENALPGLVREGPHGLEYSVVVDNNFGIVREDVLKPGRSWVNHVGGLARIDLIPDGAGGHTISQAWLSQEKSSQILPKLSLANGLLYLYTYERLQDGEYSWYFTALEFETGKTVFKIPTGQGLDYTNFGTPLVLGPGGSAYLGTMGGLLRIHDDVTQQN